MLELFDKTDTYIIEGVRFKSYHLYKAVLKAMKENNQSLNRLEKLYLYNVKIEDLYEILKIPNLKALRMRKCNIDDIKFFLGL